ncbi:ABC transporter permease [Cellulosilyticum sp. WCF-2]|nr:ABC transporter permease [Cellulosilyticum sp. WCF-2]
MFEGGIEVKILGVLVKRHMLMYLKDKQNVFFSFLSMLIILALNTVFLGDVNIKYLQEFANIEKAKALYVTNSWLMAGIMIVNAVMISCTMLGIMIKDEEDHKLQGFLVAPISRFKLVLSYIIAATITAFAFGIATFIFSQFYILGVGGSLLSPLRMLAVMGVMLVNIVSSVAMLFCITSFVHTMNSYGALTTTLGTLIGFVSAIYLPMGSLPESVQSVLKGFPILYGTAMMRELYTTPAINTVFEGAPTEAISLYKEYMGVSITWGDTQMSNGMSLLILLGSAIIFTILAGVIAKKRRISDR